MLDQNKEITPVIYNDASVKHLFFHITSGEELCFHAHWHDRMEILRITGGNLKIHLNGNSSFLSAGQAAIIGPHIIHSGFSGTDGVSYHVLMFEPAQFRNLSKASQHFIDPICNLETGFQCVTDCLPLIDSIDSLIQVVSAGGKNPLFTLSLVYHILGALYEYCPDSFVSIPKKETAFHNVLEYLNSHYSENISARDISRKFGYNEAYFCRRFKKLTGLTVMKYIFLLRMEAAHKFLENTANDIGTIAKLCGFSDISYFSNCFKKYFGHAPSAYRDSINK